MSESFTLNYVYKGNPREINFDLRISTYKYQFLCTVDNIEMIFEKDDEGNLRALEADPFTHKNKKPDMAHVKAVMNELEKILSA
jgi:hypothetical protein